MKNSDRPAFPQDFDINEAIDHGYWYEGHGLTKREVASMIAMQGILSKQAGAGDQLGDLTTQNADKIAEASIQFGDALLAKLKKTKDNE